eukprot:s1166_g9.t1
MLRWVCVLCILHGAVQVWPSFLHRGTFAPRQRHFAPRRAVPLQQAVDQLPPGATLRLPPGRHQNAEPIMLRRNITLEGLPGSEKTELESCIVFEEGAERAALRNLDIINCRRFAAVHVRCSGSPEVSGCNISSCGIGILTDAPLHTLSNPLISDCRIGPAWQGLVMAGRCRGTVERCVISDCRSAGIRLRNDARPVLRGNLVVGCQGPGMVVWNRAEAQMEDNVFLDNGESEERPETMET